MEGGSGDMEANMIKQLFATIASLCRPSKKTENYKA